MSGPNKKLIVAAEEYFADLRRVRALGGGTRKRSYYPAATDEHEDHFPKLSTPSSLRGSASEPSDWDANDIRSNWHRNVGYGR